MANPAVATTPKPSKSDLESKVNRYERMMKNLRASAAEVEERAIEVAMDLGREVLSVGTAIIGAYWAGAYGDKWTILGIDASLAIGVPGMVAGYAAVAFGYDTIGSWVMAGSRGFILESVARTALGWGQEAAKKSYAKNGAGAGAGAPPADIDPATGRPKGITYDWSGAGSGAGTNVRQAEHAWR